MILCSKHNGLLRPANDTRGSRVIDGAAIDVPKYMAHVAGRGVCIQAGGHVGAYPKEYARHFDKVYTFEPNAESFYCLAQNVIEPNVIKFQAFLAGMAGVHGSLDHTQGEADNFGAWHIKPGGDAISMTIDQLHLKPDLIQLDVEGYELYALKGAAFTIAAHKPTVIIECKSFSHNKEPELAHDWLIERGYRQVGAVNHDRIYRC